MSVVILKAGPQATVEDLGRPGYRPLGVPGGGACDAPALRIGNLLVGNAEGAAGLEITLGGLQLRFERAGLFALTGAAVPASLDGMPIAGWCSVQARAGSVLRLGFASEGARAYLCLAGGIAVPPVLGSRSTGLLAGLGGHHGRALQPGDVLVLGEPVPAPVGRAVRAPHRGEVLRVLPGPEWPLLTREQQKALLGAVWSVSPDSNRMGARLAGPALAVEAASLPSHAVLPGVVQLPPSGQPIVLLADAQTTGGYAKPLVVIAADLWRAAQLRPGDALRFAEVSTQAALVALGVQQDWINRIARRLSWAM
ncbi:biotin-dependent carboxyltransferase family protein [Chitinolyticbacter meiyuanensis]|uniref:5-oxoprolinase subunit C family protein n=1 Tax=Chitinolyticbacter meiyuanensis TaxID=682798 RepID=UPI001C9E6161|nr:biotin-dependent carboxyltransferase family protein [Chitinolyticbacter meiyuanensis]